MKRVVFVDRDGTIVAEPPDQQVDSLEKVQFVPGIIHGLRMLTDSGFELVMVSNQDGLGTRTYPKKKFDLVQKRILRLLEGEGIRFERIFICRHRAADHCACRKPAPGLLKSYLRKNSLDRRRSFVLGDRETDVAFAKALEMRSVRLTTGKTAADFAAANGFEACRWIRDASRTATMERKTAETEISATVCLSGDGRHAISTGIHFFDHMLSQLSKHSGVDLQLRARGDLQVDAHHTVEDVGIVLGNAVRNALGERRGIERFGFAAPLDEALAEVALDLSGRGHLVFRCDFRREMIGDLPSELVEDFFAAVASGLQAGIHIRCNGRNDHHKCEAIFKSFARALKQAITPAASNTIPSTKGVL